MFVCLFLSQYIFFSPFCAETKLLPPIMDDSESSCYLSKIKHIHLEYLFLLFFLIQNKSLVLTYFNFFHNQNILLKKAGMANCISVIWLHRKVGSDTWYLKIYGVWCLCIIYYINFVTNKHLFPNGQIFA